MSLVPGKVTWLKSLPSFLILAVVTGLVLAVLVHRVTVAKGLFRSGFLLPYALSFIVTGVAFRWIFNPNQKPQPATLPRRRKWCSAHDVDSFSME
jgi:ABC-type sugar transport system permease subunit